MKSTRRDVIRRAVMGGAAGALSTGAAAAAAKSIPFNGPLLVVSDAKGVVERTPAHEAGAFGAAQRVATIRYQTTQAVLISATVPRTAES